MFSTSSYNGSTKVSPKFNEGWHKAKVESVEIKTASTGRKQLLFKVFGEPVTVEGFKAFEKVKGSGDYYHGQCGIVATNYFNAEDKTETGKIMNRVILPLINAFNVKKEVDESTKNITTLEQFVTAFSPFITNKDLPYIWMNFNGEEYEKPGSDFPGYKLSFKTITNDETVKDRIPAGTMKKLPKKEVAPDSTGEVF